MATQRDPQLSDYRAKRDPRQTPEPFGRIHIPATGKLFVVQQHAARHLHFDLRLEVGGVLKSWAVPKGPSDDPADKRFAVQTEDHPLDYADFEGRIPEGNYGAGHVIVWDRGRYTRLENFESGFDKGKLLFELDGYKLKGKWTLVRLKSKTSTGKEWLLIKERDAYVADDGPSFDDTSVLSGLTVRQLANPGPKRAALTRTLGELIERQPATAECIPTKPMLATPGEASDRKGWVWELKYDGYRIMARRRRGEVALFTRNGHLLSDRFPEICQSLSHLPADEFVLDGELVVADTNGLPSFSLMQQRARLTSAHQVSAAAIERPATYYCFDLPQCDGWDLRGCALIERKRLLRQLLPQHAALKYSEHVEGGLRTFDAARQIGMEGIVGKRAASTYQHDRSSDWIKVRNQRSGDFAVIGWSPASGNSADLGSLALAEQRGGELVYVGHAGSGLSTALRRRLQKMFTRLQRKTCPLRDAPETKKTTAWLRPAVVVEVAYTEYTAYGHLRHPTIQRVRDDKSVDECEGRFESPTPGTAVSAARPAVTVTNPEKVFFPEPGYTKLDLVTYYRQIARWMLPYLNNRPIVLTRYPDGIDGKSFYQRDVPDYVPDWIRREVLWSDSADKAIHYFIVQGEEDLAYLANMGTIPIHVWHSTITDLDHPDWCVLDLDPKAAPFNDVIALAQTIGEIADEIDLPALPKTSGASGLHVLLPLGGQLTHDQSQTLGELLARLVVERQPDIATIARSVRARGNKVYVDYLQNGHGRLIAAPFAVRAEAAASVSMPLKWREVNAGLRNDKFHIGNAVRRMRRAESDPLRPVLDTSPDLARSLQRLGELLR